MSVIRILESSMGVISQGEKRDWLSVPASRGVPPPCDWDPQSWAGKKGWLSVTASRGVPPRPATGVLRARGERAAGSQSPPRGGCLPPCDGGPKRNAGKRGWLSVPATRVVPPPLRWGSQEPGWEERLALSPRLARGASPHCDGGPKSQRGRRADSQSLPRGGCLTPCDGDPKSQGWKRGWLSVPASLGVPPPPAMGVRRARRGRGHVSQSPPRGGVPPPLAMGVLRASGGRGSGFQSPPRGG
nr:putative uncharacterized protein FLJ45355 [Pan troglodytes]